MSTRPVLTPGPDHPITVDRNANRIIVRLGERVIADTTRSLTLREASYPPVHYIPREDVDMVQLGASDHATYCPYKGWAGYFSLPALGEAGDNAVWTYEQPYDAVADIAGHLAFYPNRVELTEAAAQQA
ncbi:DUF427 domain-containing protein [Sphingomonas sp.]|uniref:DUF427 domain-containing protein n=1 Tax=Sphingomonas sp. TaxID=28214 RepID=UPI001B0DD5F4|nr:DUF427 domain-containing protein [Sphingomonas sp.]MBO9712344.1 DUF427 domain-containing protein [Sphingomonas sp.]